MPTYEYECPACGCRFEKFERITAPPAGACPRCGAPGRRLISGGAGLIFRGSGFYTTDYRKESYKKEAARDCDAAPASLDSKEKAGDKPPPSK